MNFDKVLPVGGYLGEMRRVEEIEACEDQLFVATQCGERVEGVGGVLDGNFVPACYEGLEVVEGFEGFLFESSWVFASDAREDGDAGLPCWWRGTDHDEAARCEGLVGDDVLHGFADFLDPFERKDESAVPDHASRLLEGFFEGEGADLQLCDEAEVLASTSDGVQEILITILVDFDELPVARDDAGRNDKVRREAQLRGYS